MRDHRIGLDLFTDVLDGDGAFGGALTDDDIRALLD